MGRTLKTSTQLIQEFEEEWRPYARALRKEDREFLLELFAMLRHQSAPIACQSTPEPFQAFTLTMLVGILKRVSHLEIVLERYPDLRAEVEQMEHDQQVTIQPALRLLQDSNQ